MELLDGIELRREAELMSEYAYQLPVRVICHLLGVPAADFPRFRGWVVDLVRRFDVADPGSKKVTARGDVAAAELDRYIRELAARRREEPTDDLLSALVHAVDEGDRLDEDELVSVVVLLLAAGHETTANLIGNSVWHLSRHREQRERWRREPELRRNAVEELLRYDSPVQMVQRIAVEDLRMRGVRIPKGRLVIPLIGAANRDPERFTDPDRLDLARAAGSPASFGFGAHHCLGAALARVEGEVALAALYDRLPRVRPAVDKPPWRRSIIFRGLTELPVVWA